MRSWSNLPRMAGKSTRNEAVFMGNWSTLLWLYGWGISQQLGSSWRCLRSSQIGIIAKLSEKEHQYEVSHRIHVCYIWIYMVTWIPSIYPSHVSIYTSTMDHGSVMGMQKSSIGPNHPQSSQSSQSSDAWGFWIFFGGYKLNCLVVYL